MSASSLDKRLRSLEAKNTQHIATLADYVLWQAHGRPEPVTWDPQFKSAIEKAFERISGLSPRS